MARLVLISDGILKVNMLTSTRSKARNFMNGSVLKNEDKMAKYRATKNNIKSTMCSTKNHLQAKTRTLEAQIDYPELSIEDIYPTVAVAGVPVPGKTPVTKPNIPPPPLLINLIHLRLLH